jgi:RNA polymerase sigma-70 factor (ECF subfamily)
MSPAPGQQPNLLIQQARAGDLEALGQLFDSYRNYLRLLARTGIDLSHQGKADPSDLVQEALLRASHRFDQFQGMTEPELAGWLRSILARCLADLTRRPRRRVRPSPREVSLDQLLDRSSQVLEQILAAPSHSPSDSVARRDLGVVLADALAQLSEDHREVLVLRNLEDLSWTEIAQLMGRTPNAVRMLWTRALVQIQPLLKGRV